jgi:replicative DNA helicase
MTKKNLTDYAGPDEIITSQQMRHELGKTKNQVFAIRFKPEFFPSLIGAVRGFQEGELVIISGPPKAGKTLFAQSLTYAFSQGNIDSLWFSYEVPARQFIDSFPREMFPKFFLPREIHANTIDWFEERSLEAWEKYRNRVVFIDHLHFLFDMARVRNASLEIGAYVRRIKRFAILHGLIVFLIWHLTKVEPGTDISYNNLRDSSFAAQESDTIFLIRRLFNDQGEVGDEAELKIAFHRRTGIMGRRIDLIKQAGYLWEKAAHVPADEETTQF